MATKYKLLEKGIVANRHEVVLTAPASWCSCPSTAPSSSVWVGPVTFLTSKIWHRDTVWLHYKIPSCWQTCSWVSFSLAGSKGSSYHEAKSTWSGTRGGLEELWQPWSYNCKDSANNSSELWSRFFPSWASDEISALAKHGLQPIETPKQRTQPTQAQIPWPTETVR